MSSTGEFKKVRTQTVGLLKEVRRLTRGNRVKRYTNGSENGQLCENYKQRLVQIRTITVEFIPDEHVPNAEPHLTHFFSSLDSISAQIDQRTSKGKKIRKAYITRALVNHRVLFAQINGKF